MHLAQAKTLFPYNGFAAFGDFAPIGTIVHCKLGYFLYFLVGLYLPLSFFNFQFTVEVFPQIEQILLIFLKLVTYNS